MKRRYYHIISIIAIVVVVCILYAGYASRVQTASTPPLLYSYAVSTPNAGQISNVEGDEYINVTQGSTQQINITFTSLTSLQIAIPIENLTITTYTDINGYSFWASAAQPQVINYSFSQNQINLQPNVSNSTILTIKWANNAPIGTYTLNIDLGFLKFLSTPGRYDKSYSSSIWLGVNVSQFSSSLLIIP
jgi:hypothetical protein